MKKVFALIFAAMCFSAQAQFLRAADNGTEFFLEDDVTVYGAGGTSADPDLEIKGFSVFGATQAAYAGAAAGPGNVVINGAVSVSSGAYFAGNSTFTAALNMYINDGTAGQLLQKSAAGNLNWAAPASLGDGLGGHVATTTLSMQSFPILDASTVNARSAAIGDGVMVGAPVSLLLRPPSASYDYLVYVTTGFYPDTPSLVVSSAGYIGLGTASPSEKLHINGGGIRATGSISAAAYQVGGSTVLAILPGSGSLAVGAGAGPVDFSDYNTFLGSQSGGNNMGGAHNTFLGSQAGYANVNGSNNTFVGYQAGNGASGTNNIVIGSGQTTSNSAASYEMNMGGILFGDLSARTIGISTRSPQAALDIVSTGTANNVYAQIWRNAAGTVVASMTATGFYYGNGSGLTGVFGTDGTKLPLTGGSLSGTLSVFSSTAAASSDIVTNGLVVSTGGAVRTTGLGNGTVIGNARGTGAVDLQTLRLSPGQVASGAYSVIGGGQGNTASADWSAVGGGYGNTASVLYAFAGGGTNNSASGGYSFVGGGNSNQASNGWATVAGGMGNIASQNNATVGGGDSNKASGYSATVAGGIGNNVSAGASSVGGGYNIVSGSNSVIPGGGYNAVTGTSSVVSGGEFNRAGGRYSVIGGGNSNTADAGAERSFIGGGAENIAAGYGSAIAGGWLNRAGASGYNYSAVVAGWGNMSIGYASFIGAGGNNVASGMQSVVPGGGYNTAKGDYSFAAGFRSSSTASGTFTWTDSLGAPVDNSVANQVMFKASGGFWVSTGAVYGTPGLYVSTSNNVVIGTAAALSARLAVIEPNPRLFSGNSYLLKVGTNAAGDILSVSTAGAVAISGDLNARVWQRIFSTDLTGDMSVFNIFNLRGNTDEEYKIIIRLRQGGASATCTVQLCPNGITMPGSYNSQYYGATGATAVNHVVNAGTLGYIPIATVGMGGIIETGTLIEGTLYAKGPDPRVYSGTMVSITQLQQTTRQIGAGWYGGAGAEITSLTINTDSPGCLGTGTHIELWAFR